MVRAAGCLLRNRGVADSKSAAVPRKGSDPLRFASSITTQSDPKQAVEELLAPLDARVTVGMVDLALLFFTAHYIEDLEFIVDRLGDAFPNGALIGFSTEGTIGRNVELERTISMSLVVASLPDVVVRPFRMTQQNLESVKTPADWGRFVGVSPDSKPVFIALGDPFQFAIQDFLKKLNDAYCGAPLIGGVASAAMTPEQNRLIVNGTIYNAGMVGVALSGALEVETVVSQGCRPIGRPFVITKADRNVISDLGGKAPLEQLHSVLVELSEEDEQLAKQSLFVGRVINEYKENFVRGDFLIHNIIGVDRESGSVAIAGHARVGSTVQFHVRDADSADEDLRALLTPHVATDVRGALLFGCNGRGTHMWSEPGHDAGVLFELFGDLPVAGCFCAGEFGPVGGTNFVHGFTASIGLFRPSEESVREPT